MAAATRDGDRLYRYGGDEFVAILAGADRGVAHEVAVRIRRGVVELSNRTGGPHVEISVADNGPGIAAAVQERLFHPLTTSKSDGLGLGLSIAASIIEAHGGRIWLAAAEPGATEFRFTLPLDR